MIRLDADGPDLTMSGGDLRDELRFDCRWLDRVWARRMRYGWSLLAAIVSVVALLFGTRGILPGGEIPIIMSALSLGYFGQQAYQRLRGSELVLEVDEWWATLQVPRGWQTALQLEAALDPWTRSAPIRSDAIYEDALTRLSELESGDARAILRERAQSACRMGSLAIYVDEQGSLWIGGESFTERQVLRTARRGEDLRLESGTRLWGAFLLLAYAAHESAETFNAVGSLHDRIWRYRSTS
jgi:hypothetical protein